MKFVRLFLLVLTGLSLSTHELQANLSSRIIQTLIDDAPSGTEIIVPAGHYRGSIRIKDDVVVRGSGADSCVIDGDGKGIGVLLGKNSAIIGFKIQNAPVLVHNQGNFAAVFECALFDYTQHAVLFSGGSGVLAHNRLQGNGSAVGVMVANANPLIVNNHISSNQTGVQITPNLTPTIMDNLFSNNAIAVAAIGTDARAALQRNIYDGNAQVTSGFASAGEVDPSGTGAGGFRLESGVATDAYRNLMRETFTTVVKHHPIIVYDLQPEAGAFDAIGLFPWATFTLTASTKDTVIQEYRAFDLLTRDSLHAEYAEDQMRPSVRVLNPQLTEKMRERYVLENRYVHPASYFDETPDRRTFKRMTNVAQIEVVIPEGYALLSSQPEGRQTSDADGRDVVVITSMGETIVQVNLERKP